MRARTAHGDHGAREGLISRSQTPDGGRIDEAIALIIRHAAQGMNQKSMSARHHRENRSQRSQLMTTI
ncbi:MAG: hypothetical protein ACLP9Y_11780 [Mycobacterium sp.]